MFEFKKDVYFFWLGIGARGGGVTFFLGGEGSNGKEKVSGVMAPQLTT